MKSSCAICPNHSIIIDMSEYAMSGQEEIRQWQLRQLVEAVERLSYDPTAVSRHTSSMSVEPILHKVWPEEDPLLEDVRIANFFPKLPNSDDPAENQTHYYTLWVDDLFNGMTFPPDRNERSPELYKHISDVHLPSTNDMWRFAQRAMGRLSLACGVLTKEEYYALILWLDQEQLEEACDKGWVRAATDEEVTKVLASILIR